MTTAPVSSPSFGERLRAYRIAAGLSQAALAEQAGVSVRAVSDLERGARRAPYPRTIACFAAALGLSNGERTALEATVSRRRGPLVADAAAPVPGWLPVSVTPLIGREAEAAAICATLMGGETRLVTLTGPGGVGKTRLALAVAASLRAAFPDGVWFIPLAAITDPVLIAPLIGQSLGIRNAGYVSPHEGVRSVLAARRVLLVLDNFEHLVAGALLVADLLAACPALVVLVTSRAPLHLSGEREWSVPPLPLPDAATVTDVEAVARSPAVALFVARAQAAPLFVLDAANAPVVAAICARLDGLPLALELAAARVKLLPPRAMLARLERRLDVLTGGSRDRPARHQTLRETIAWSDALLDPDERRWFARLAIFTGGWTLTAAEAVCAPGNTDGALDALSSLVDKSLIRPVGGPDGEPRFAMLEIVREYAREQLTATGEETVIADAHARWFARLASDTVARITGSEQAALLDCLEAEHDNLRAALSWAIERGAAETAALLATSLSHFWEVRGHLTEGRTWLRRVHDCTAVGDDLATRAQLGYAAGRLASAQGDYVAARVHQGESAAIFRGLGDVQGLATTLGSLGTIAEYHAEYATARACFEESLALLRPVGNSRGLGRALNGLALFRYKQREYDVAWTLWEEALETWRALGDELAVGITLNNLGLIARDRTEYEAARQLYAQSLPIFRVLGHRRMVGKSLGNLSIAAQDQGDFAASSVFLTESLVVFRELDDREGIADQLDGFARLARRGGRFERAARLWGAAAAVRAAAVIHLSPREHAAQADDIAATQRAIGMSHWAAAWAIGQADTAEGAISLALDGTPVAAASARPSTTQEGWSASLPGILTARETEILHLIAAGKRNREIASTLHLSVRTVERHITNLYRKSDVRGRADATAFALRRTLY
ncbi:MAG: tetratricopeptide repeat protein [Chloroflexota bacterium]|nr:tetratricopeptide repeat protein [Chloroflexota bacterium]